jgi:hypothetical protein
MYVQDTEFCVSEMRRENGGLEIIYTELQDKLYEICC